MGEHFEEREGHFQGEQGLQALLHDDHVSLLLPIQAVRKKISWKKWFSRGS